MSFKDKTILVVDDDIEILKLLGKILTAAGLNVLMADSPAMARPIIEKDPPHVILTDLHMTPENGFEFIQSIRNEKKYSGIPIIVLSALNDFQSVKKAIALGVNDYAIKPIQAPVILRKLRKVLHNKDFAKWEPSADQRPVLTIELTGEVTDLGEAGCMLSGPFKISSGKDIKIDSIDFNQCDLHEVTHRSSPAMKRYRPGGNFDNDITFVGITENIQNKVRQLIQKRTRR